MIAVITAVTKLDTLEQLLMQCLPVSPLIELIVGAGWQSYKTASQSNNDHKTTQIYQFAYLTSFASTDNQVL